MVKERVLKKEIGKFLYEQLYEIIRNDIYDGYLNKNDKLMSIRAAEKKYKISKTCVEKAYMRLLDEGLIIGKEKSGYFVAIGKEHIDLHKRMIQQQKKQYSKQYIYDFRSQSIDMKSFDQKLWKKYIKDVLEQQDEIETYGHPQGEYALRIALQSYAYATRHVLADVEEMIIGSSFQSLLFIFAGLLDKGGCIGMEENGFSQAETVFSNYGFSIIKINFDDEKKMIQDLIDHQIKILYVNTHSIGKNHEELSEDKKRVLIEWAQDYHVYIIEDDHNGELSYRNENHFSLQGLDMGKRVCYIGSFSRLLLPSLRISYMVLPHDLALIYLTHQSQYAPTASKIEQLALAHYISDGHLQRHIVSLIHRYAYKSKLMEKYLKTYLPDVSYHLEEKALRYRLSFDHEMNIKYIFKVCEDKNIALDQESNDLMLSFSAISDQDMEKAIQMIAEIITMGENM